MTDRNLKPHAEAALAMAIWSDEYAAQNGGSMDFWDGLSPRRKYLCASIIDRVFYAAQENGRALLSKLEGL
ncbi:hypothetical protein PH562_16495 [Rhizobium sp. CNPSo 4062]|uniref:hypothetical protein n=1 Tax=Rhizobium sp. CNPSo 4062 TaxID=3021410 RepID=UPI00254B60F5|nr:hypothetical protein [Rhizobium sp. CNPSo 4062]MDK4703852.1 hypothetical protein [Rhizobium sp. CNPSo 4062]